MKYDLVYSLPVFNHEKIEWKEVFHFVDEFLLVGITASNFLCVCRGNIQGETEFYQWEEKIDDWDNIVIQAQPEITNQLFIIHRDYQFFEEKVLNANDVFSKEIIIKGLPKIFEAQPYLLPCSICMNIDREYVLFKDDQFYFFNDKFEFKENIFRKKIMDAVTGSNYQFSQKKVVESTKTKNHYFLHDQNTIIDIDCVSGTINQHDEIITDNEVVKGDMMGVYQFHEDFFYKNIIVTNKEVFCKEEYNEVDSLLCHKQHNNIIDAQKLFDNLLVILIKDENTNLCVAEVIEIKPDIILMFETKHHFKLKNDTKAILPSLEEGKYYFLENSGNVVSYEI